VKQESLSPKEHDGYIHSCGKTGIELERIVKQDKDFCHRCVQLEKCFETHTVPKWEAPVVKKKR